MKNHTNPATKLSLLATGAAALTGSAQGAVTLFDNGGSGWSFNGRIDETSANSNNFVTSLDTLGILPAGLLDLTFGTSTGPLKIHTSITVYGEEDGELPPDHDYTSVGGSILGGGETYTRADLLTSEATLAASVNSLESDGYLVFALYDQANEDAADNSGYYLGWAELEASISRVNDDNDPFTDDNDPWSLNIKRIGIENEVNQAIVVGAIPEASSTALLLLGAAGAAARRRRKAA